MDWNIRERVLGYFVDFVVGEIDEIENIISWADARNHPETAMKKIRQIVVARQEVAIYARDVLMEQTKLPDRWTLAAAGAGTLQWRKKKDRDRSKVGTSGPGESSDDPTENLFAMVMGRCAANDPTKNLFSMVLEHCAADDPTENLLAMVMGRCAADDPTENLFAMVMGRCAADDLTENLFAMVMGRCAADDLTENLFTMVMGRCAADDRTKNLFAMVMGRCAADDRTENLLVIPVPSRTVLRHSPRTSVASGGE